MGIKNSKQSVNISTIPKNSAKGSEVTEKGDVSEKSADNLKGESIKDLVEKVSVEPVKDDDIDGQVVPVLKVEDEEVAGVEEEDKEVPKPMMSKIASMKRDLSFGRLQKMFSREAKSEPQQEADKVADPTELSATDEKMNRAEDAMGEKFKNEEVKGEDIESRVTGLKRSLMKIFTRESESDGAGSPLTATENEGTEEKGVEEGSPAKMSSLKKRLSFKAVRSKFSKEKKEMDTGEGNNEEKEEENAKMGDENESGEKKESGEEGEIATDETKKELQASPKVNQDQGEAESEVEPTLPTGTVSVLPEELKQSGADAEKQPEKVAQELLDGESGETELERESREDAGE